MKTTRQLLLRGRSVRHPDHEIQRYVTETKHYHPKGSLHPLPEENLNDDEKDIEDGR
jgi:hypothetical protein